MIDDARFTRRHVLALASVAAAVGVLPRGARASGEKLVAWASSPVTAQLLRDGFPKVYSGYDLEVVEMADTDIMKRLVIAIQSGGTDVPDAVQIDARETGDLFATGQFMDLTSELEPERTNFPEGVLLESGGKIISYVQGPGNMVFWHNATVLESHGLELPADGTWDEVLDVARALRDATGGKSHLFTRPSGYSGFLLYNGFFNSRGGNWWDGDGNLVADVDLAADTLQFIVNLKNEGLSYPTHTGEPNFWDLIRDRTMVGYTMGLTQGLNLKRNVPEQEGEWRIATWPRWSADADKRTGNYGGSSWAAMKNASNPQGAKDLVMFWLSDEGIKAQFQRLGAVAYGPASNVIDMNVGDAYFGGQPVSAIAMSVSSPPFNYRNWTATSSAMTNAVEAALGGIKTPRQAIEDGLSELASL